ncbi:hypothetical protein D6745_04710 [Candidatus Woesearchaeota archaeon]|nr:MAG: hypothetical protein D6745_04710 [Candidatus Woesearchaeota archaeon]
MKKKNENYITYGIIIIAAVILAYSVAGFLKTNNGPDSPKTEIPETPEFEPVTTGTTEPGSVSVELQPQYIKDSRLVVNARLNTHSVDLSQFDLKQVTTLEYNGKTVNPIEAPQLSGHHSRGNIIFEVGEEPESFRIIIKGIPNVEERIFEWR